MLSEKLDVFLYEIVPKHLVWFSQIYYKFNTVSGAASFSDMFLNPLYVLYIFMWSKSVSS